MTVFKKTFLSLGIAAIGFSAVLVVFSFILMNFLYYEINTAGLKNTANTLLTAIGEDRIVQIFIESADNDSILNELTLPVDKNGEHRLSLIAGSGYVLWDSHATDLVNHLDREEINSALQGKEASARRNSISTGNKLIYYALPVFYNDKVAGVFRLSVSVPGFSARVSPVILPFIIYSCLMAIIVFWAIDAYSRSLADSVGRLVKIVQSGTPFLSGPEAKELVSPEFRSLEKTLRAMTAELNMRFERAKAENARLEAILNGMSEAVFAMDSELKLHLVNPCARKIFNLGDQNIDSLSLLEATHSAELEDIAKKALDSNTTLEMELTLYTGGSAAEQNFQVYAAKITESGGIILVLQDITRLVKLERIRKDFVANVSHELRTPIQLIKGFSETLIDTINDSLTLANDDKKQTLHFIEIIQKNAGTMENLTNDLLTLSSLENNGINPRNTEDVFVAFLIEEAVSSLQLPAKRKNIEIITECDKEIKAKLHGSFIIQALINLIDNAIKYSPEKSKVWVKGYLDISEVSELVLEVRDEGIGIPKDNMERIFERFYRVDKARSKEAGGTGLGLSIVKHIVLLHNGKIEVESVHAKAGNACGGSVFRVRIPA